MRVYDPRIGKFLSVDPLTKSFPQLTPYQYAENQPIWAIDLDGLEKYIVTNWYSKEGDLTKITIKGIQAKDTKKMVDLDFKRSNGGDLTNSDVYVRYMYNNGKQKSPSTSQSSLSADEKKIYAGAQSYKSAGDELINYSLKDQYGGDKIVSANFDANQYRYLEAEALFNKPAVSISPVVNSPGIVLPGAPAHKPFSGSSDKGSFEYKDDFYSNARNVAKWLVDNPNHSLEISVDGLMIGEKNPGSWDVVVPGSKSVIDWNGTTYGERVDNLLKEFRNMVVEKLRDMKKGKEAAERLKLKRGAIGAAADHYKVKE